MFKVELTDNLTQPRITRGVQKSQLSGWSVSLPLGDFLVVNNVGSPSPFEAGNTGLYMESEPARFSFMASALSYCPCSTQ